MNGLGLLLFQNDHWVQRYAVNCTLHPMTGFPNVPIGMIYFSFGIICELMYIPFMIVMSKRDCIQYTCYQFMFLIGFIDMFTLIGNAIISGVQGMFGIHFCNCPTLFFISGSIATAGWFGVSFTCSILAINRFFEFLFPKISQVMFGGRMMKIWLLIPTSYWIFNIFTMTPAVYNIQNHGFYYDPYVGTMDLEGNVEFSHTQMLIYNSYFTLPVIGGAYLILCTVITVQTKIFKNAPKLPKLQRIMLLQSICICLEIFVVGTVYVANSAGLFEVPKFVVIIEQFTWVCVHGDTPIVYLIFNESLRNKVLTMCKNFFVKRPNGVGVIVKTFAPQISNPRRTQ